MIRKLTVEHHSVGDHKNPVKTQLRLKGRWLADAGFRPGDKVEVRVDAGVLVVEKIKR